MPDPISSVGRSQADREMEVEMKKYLNTEKMLEENFLRNLEAVGSGLPVDIASSGDRTLATTSAEDGPHPPSAYERAILEMGSIRDEIAASIINVQQEPVLAESLKKLVARVENGIRRLGGEVEPFNELSYMSGLGKIADSQTGILVNAERVVANTKANYKGLGFTIAGIKAKVLDDRPAIVLRVEGADNGRPFQAFGKVVADTDFTGNEAVDFVRKNGMQMFSVRAVQLGVWKDVSDNFTIEMASASQKSSQPAQPAQPSQPPAPAVPASVV